MRSGVFVVATICIMGIFGCHSTGPASVETERAGYNLAIQQTNSEQLLLNLVRLRYRDVPYFLEVASVSTTFDFTSSASASALLPESESKAYGLDAGISFSEQPTITYTPLQGDQFVRQLMSPIDLTTILLLYNSGWSIERIFRVSIQSINGLRNAPSASGPTPDRVPEYKEFCRVASLLRELQVKGVIEMGRAQTTDNNDTAVELHIAEAAADSQPARQLREMLGLTAGRTRFRLTTGTGGGERIAVATRSLMASLFYVSQSVEVPESDEKAGRVTVTHDAEGGRFDWQEVTGGLMRIRSAERRPQTPYVTVFYRDSWFYIDDSDLTSKSTFSLLTQLFALQAGEVSGAAPLLTLPVR
jgi:hypothetical protein